MEHRLNSFLENLIVKLKTIETEENLSLLKKEYISSKGSIQDITIEFKKLDSELKKKYGELFIHVKKESNQLIENKERELKVKFSGIEDSTFFDPHLNKNKQSFFVGELHPYTETLKKIETFFNSFGFEVVEGNIIERDFFNFTALNIDEDHPARNEHDTFYLKENNMVLRTHTSAVQVKEALKRTPPFALISSGPVYRNEATDASHDFMFYQLEGLFISEKTSISELLYVMNEFLKDLFNKSDLTIRTRPSTFPFVEPGLEIDMSCPFCTEGCSTCKKTRWIEIVGAGMVHPFVMEKMNIEYPKYQGWAFGFGLTRLVALLYSVSDIRLLHNSVFSPNKDHE